LFYENKSSLMRNSISRSPLRYGLFLTSLALALMGGMLERSTNAAFPGQNGKIAFHSFRGGNLAIFTVNPDGSGLAQVTSGLANDSLPSWSPDGSKIVFRSDRDGNFEIYSMNADGSGQTRLTSNPSADEFPAWSPDGTRIVFDSDRDGNLEIYSMNADGSGQTRLTSSPATDIAPAWSPDGTKIAFDSDRGGNRDVYTMNSDGSNVVQLTSSATTDSDPNWSPDGTKLAFAGDRNGNLEIYTMNSDGSNVTNLTRNRAYDADPAWAPDGSMITFTTNRNGSNEIAVMSADGSGQTIISTGPDGFPDWQPIVPSVTTILVDVKPGSTRNPINLRSHGLIPVAILTTDTFDATTVDPSTVCFGDADDPEQRDCTEAHSMGHIEDVNGDGRPDLLLHYETSETGIDPGDTQACLTGETFDGVEVEGCDAITTR
jgi:Tol biopolymer transport system component